MLLTLPFDLLIAFLAAIIVAITVHEFAHAWTANYLGDPTAKLEGRISLNPLVHLDAVGTIILLLAGFGWGKPVPYNPNYLKNPRLGSLLIAIAGPISNFILALLFAIPLKYGSPAHILYGFFSLSFSLNIALMVFNLLPIPPLDGSKILAYFIPSKYARQWNAYLRKGPIVLLGIILLERITGIYILSIIIGSISQKIALLIGLAS